MYDYGLLLKFLTALAIGAIIGTVKEKEKAVKRNFGGFRTFILVALTGAFAHFLGTLTGIVWLFPIIFIGIVVMTGLSYIFMAKQGRIGIKTELAIFLTYILGYIAMTEYATLAIILSAMIVIIIESDMYVHKFIRSTNMEEWLATLSFGAVALIIYPVLPNQYIDPFRIINPSRIWLLVVLISGVGFIGYFLIKTLGSRKGILLSGILGGLVSSTATTLSLSIQSKQFPRLTSPLILATTVSSIIMYLRVLAILVLIAPALFLESFPYILLLMLIMAGSSLIFCKDIILNYVHSDISKIELAHESPFRFIPALKLALLFTVIRIAAEFTLNNIGNQGIYLISLVSGLVDADPIVLTLSAIFKTNLVNASVITVSLLIALSMNTLFKGIIAYLNGSCTYSYKILAVFGATFVSGLGIIAVLILNT